VNRWKSGFVSHSTRLFRVTRSSCTLHPLRSTLLLVGWELRLKPLEWQRMIVKKSRNLRYEGGLEESRGIWCQAARSCPNRKRRERSEQRSWKRFISLHSSITRNYRKRCNRKIGGSVPVVALHFITIHHISILCSWLQCLVGRVMSVFNWGSAAGMRWRRLQELGQSDNRENPWQNTSYILVAGNERREVSGSWSHAFH
jgi:hypothetical protein